MACKKLKKIFKLKKKKQSSADGEVNLIGRKYVTIENKVFNGGSWCQIFLEDSHNIIIKNCIFKNLDSSNGHAILMYGCDHVAIHDCVFKDLKCGNSETVAINTGCTNVRVTDCHFENIDNLPLDVIAGERDDKYTGKVKILRNRFINCGYRNDYWTAAGPYVDGASDVVIQNNYINCSNIDGKSAAMGIEIGAENKRTAKNILVKDNVILNARVAGIIYGSYKSWMAGVDNVVFENNRMVNCKEDYKEQKNAKNVVVDEEKTDK